VDEALKALINLELQWDRPFDEIDVSEPFVYDGKLCWKIDAEHYQQQGFRDMFTLEPQTMVTPLEQPQIVGVQRSDLQGDSIELLEQSIQSKTTTECSFCSSEVPAERVKKSSVSVLGDICEFCHTSIPPKMLCDNIPFGTDDVLLHIWLAAARVANYQVNHLENGAVEFVLGLIERRQSND